MLLIHQKRLGGGEQADYPKRGDTSPDNAHYFTPTCVSQK